jgi:hypothetical protein
VARHESLRTVFPDDLGTPRQRILAPEEAEPILLRQEISAAALPEALARAAGHGFELRHELPLRAWLFRHDAEQHTLLLLLHHIAADGWSLAPLARDLARAYGARCQGQGPAGRRCRCSMPTTPSGSTRCWATRPSPTARWPASWPTGRRPWPACRRSLCCPATGRARRCRPYRGGSVSLAIGAGLHQRLRDLARDSQASLFMVLQAGLATLLTRLGAGHDIPLGSPIAGRTDEALDDLVGLFVNTLVLRTSTAGDPSFRELLGRVRESDLAAYAHQDLPFERLVELLNPARSLARHPLFQVMLVLQNTAAPALHLAGLAVAPRPLGQPRRQVRPLPLPDRAARQLRCSSGHHRPDRVRHRPVRPRQRRAAGGAAAAAVRGGGGQPRPADRGGRHPRPRRAPADPAGVERHRPAGA